MIIGFTTTNSKKNADHIVKVLLSKKLVSCASIVSGVSSSYLENGKIKKAKEFLLVFKSRTDLKDEIAEELKKIHVYKIPEIIFINGEARNPYLYWLLKETKK